MNMVFVLLQLANINKKQNGQAYAWSAVIAVIIIKLLWLLTVVTEDVTSHIVLSGSF